MRAKMPLNYVATIPPVNQCCVVCLHHQKTEPMNKEVTHYIEKLPDWQVSVCEELRKTIYQAMPGVEERIQYGKPHYLKNGHYAAVISASKEKVVFNIFNAEGLDEIEGFFVSTTTPQRKAAMIKKGQHVDYAQLGDFLQEAVKTLK
jgi:hypothetical protein